MARHTSSKEGVPVGVRSGFVGLVILALLVAACSGGGGDTTRSTDPGGDATTTTGSDWDDSFIDGLPEGFPSDQIPLVDGEVIRGGGTPESGVWIVLVRTDGPRERAVERAAQALLGAGFERDPDGGFFDSDTYRVNIQSVQDRDKVILNYSISIKRTR